MYHEEKVINGVLCWRGTPKGDWIEYSKEQLTEKLLSYKEQLRKVDEMLGVREITG